MKNISLRITVAMVLVILGCVLFWWKTYPFPGKDDFRKNEKQYTKIIDLLSGDSFSHVTYLWDLSVVNDGIRCYYRDDVDCKTRYAEIINEEALLAETYFQKCPNGIIKISKWWWLNNFFEVVYLYSKDGFSVLPSRARGRINDHVILYHNYSDTYTTEDACQLK